MKEKDKNSKIPAKGKKAKEEIAAPISLDDDIAERDAEKAGKSAEPAELLKENRRESVLDAPETSEENEPLLTSDLAVEQSRRSIKSGILTATVVISALFGLGGGVVGSIYLAPWLQDKLALPASSSAATEKKKVVLEENSALIDVVKEVNPAVVSIVASQELSQVESYFLNPFGINLPQGETFQKVSAGSGFIVSADGLIITNKHVVEDDNAEYAVIMHDGTKYTGKILAKDPLNDLAVVKIEANNLPTVSLGDSDALQLGQRVIAIGNALGEFNNTITAGIISGIGRTVSAGNGMGQQEQLQQVIQTDAAINPGNSGGPLLNLAGQVIGVNTAIDQTGQLIGFAIPSNEAKKVLDDVQKFGRVLRPFMGVRYVMLNDDVAKQSELSVNQGAFITKGSDSTQSAIVPGSPAEKAGLTEGDIILEVSGKKLDSNNTLSAVLKAYKPGDQIVLKVLRGKDTKEILLTLGEA